MCLSKSGLYLANSVQQLWTPWLIFLLPVEENMGAHVLWEVKDLWKKRSHIVCNISIINNDLTSVLILVFCKYYMQLDLTNFSVTGVVTVKKNTHLKYAIPFPKYSSCQIASNFASFQKEESVHIKSKSFQLIWDASSTGPCLFFGVVANGTWEVPVDGFGSINWSSPLCFLAMVWKTEVELCIFVLNFSLKWICIVEF